MDSSAHFRYILSNKLCLHYSTNIIVSDLSAYFGYRSISMFELAYVGLPLAAAGLPFIMLAAPRLLPDMLNHTCELENNEKRRYLAEISIPRGSSLTGLSPCDGLLEKYPGIEVLELIHDSHIHYPCRDHVIIAPGDLLLVKGSPNALVNMLNEKSVELPSSQEGLKFGGPQGNRGDRADHSALLHAGRSATARNRIVPGPGSACERHRTCRSVLS